MNKKIYQLFEAMLTDLKSKDWMQLYIKWELNLIKELGFGNNININLNPSVKKSLILNRNLLMENFIIPNGLKFPFFRKILENYFD